MHTSSVCRTTAVLAILLVIAATGASAQSASDRELVKGIRQVEDGYLDDAVVTLEGVVRTFSEDPARRRELARAYLYLGIAHAHLDAAKPARASFREALKLNPDLKLDAEQWPPKVLRAFAAVQAELAPPPSPSPTPSAAQATPVPSPTPSPAEPAASTSPRSTDASGLTVTLDTTLGPITIALDRQKAPISVDNFLRYARAHHYEGTIFHRVIPDFMIQGGGMDSTMRERPTQKPIKNEAKNGLRNTRGTVAMARTSDPDSGTAQFFINLKDNPALDYGARGAGYAVFGEVVDGMAVVDRIARVGTTTVAPHANVPITPVVITAVHVHEPVRRF